MVLQRFFKTGPGEYGEGDRFLGVRVPAIRKLARECDALGAKELRDLLKSTFHEERLLALVILVRRFSGGTEGERQRIYRFYLAHTRCINNWDLVDLSAEHIVGAYLMDKSRQPLHDLAVSSFLWERRMAIVSTFHFIRRGDFDATLQVARMLLDDKEDLIHKATGWMLREVGKRDLKVEKQFLKEHYRMMPRTMLRYAIEKLAERRRQQYLKGLV